MHCAMVSNMAMHSPTDLVGTAEICRSLEVNPATVSRWVKTKKIHPVHRLPGKNGAFLFTRAELDRFTSERAAAAEAASA